MISDATKTDAVTRGAPAGHDSSDVSVPARHPESSCLVDQIQRLLLHLDDFEKQTALTSLQHPRQMVMQAADEAKRSEQRIAADGFIAGVMPFQNELEASLIACQSFPCGRHIPIVLNAFYMRSGLQDIVHRMPVVAEPCKIARSLDYPRALILRTPLSHAPVENGSAILVNESDIAVCDRNNSKAITINKGSAADISSLYGLFVTTKSINSRIVVGKMIITYDCDVTIPSGDPGGMLEIVQVGKGRLLIPRDKVRIWQQTVHIRPSSGSVLYKYLQEMRAAVEGSAEQCTAYFRGEGDARLIRDKISGMTTAEECCHEN